MKILLYQDFLMMEQDIANYQKTPYQDQDLKEYFNMPLLQQQEEQLKNDHQIWLRLPTTQLFLRAIDNLEKRTVSMLVSDLNPKEPSIAHQHGTMIKSIREVKKIAEDSETFIARSTQR